MLSQSKKHTGWLGHCVRHYSDFNFCGDNDIHCSIASRTSGKESWKVARDTFFTSYAVCWRRYCYGWVFQPPSIGHSLRYISVSFLVCTCILLLAAVRASDVAGSSLAAHLCLRHTCVCVCAALDAGRSASALTSRDHLID